MVKLLKTSCQWATLQWILWKAKSTHPRRQHTISLQITWPLTIRKCSSRKDQPKSMLNKQWRSTTLATYRIPWLDRSRPRFHWWRSTVRRGISRTSPILKSFKIQLQLQCREIIAWKTFPMQRPHLKWHSTRKFMTSARHRVRKFQSRNNRTVLRSFTLTLAKNRTKSASMCDQRDCRPSS